MQFWGAVDASEILGELSLGSTYLQCMLKGTPNGLFSEYGLKMQYVFNSVREVEHALVGIAGLPLWLAFTIRPIADFITGIFGILLAVDA